MCDGELLHEAAAIAGGQGGEQGLGLVVDRGLLLGERAPVLVELCRILAAQQRVFPFLHFRLERAQKVRDISFMCVLGTDLVLVDRERLIQAVDPDQGGARHRRDDAADRQREFQFEVHSGFRRGTAGFQVPCGRWEWSGPQTHVCESLYRLPSSKLNEESLASCLSASRRRQVAACGTARTTVLVGAEQVRLPLRAGCPQGNVK